MMNYLQGVFISAMIVFCLYQIIEKKQKDKKTRHSYYWVIFLFILWLYLFNGTNQ